MRKILPTLILAILALIAQPIQAQSIYDFTVKNDEGKDVSLADYKGKVLLIVNTATKCGFTPQYKELEALYEKYHAQGFEILDFPCNQFGQQAPGSIDVNGKNESPLYTYLKSQKSFGGFNLKDKLGSLLDGMLRKQDVDYDKKPSIKWNFTKFLIDQQGRVVKRYEPTDSMEKVGKDIEQML